MAIDGWGKTLAAVVVVSAWCVTPVSGQQSLTLGRTGFTPHGHVESSDPHGPASSRPDSEMVELVRLPAVEQTPWVIPSLIPSSQPGILPHAKPESKVDGTWQEDGQFLILNLNGQQLRLAKKAPLKAPSHAHAPVLQNVPTVGASPGGGEVRGQLSHRGQPLVGCEVAMVPLSKSWLGYRDDHSAKPLLTTTDAEGAYTFVQVPAGPYKLKWRPVGETSWIRHAETRPDVFVRTGEMSQAKKVRVALRTIN